MKEVVDAKNDLKDAFKISDFKMTKKVKLQLRNRIWWQLYYLLKGKENPDKWVKDQYDVNPNKQIRDLEGMRTCSDRASKIMNTVCSNNNLILTYQHSNH